MRLKPYGLARPMLIFYSLTFYGLNSSLSSNLNVVYTCEEGVCCQHCAAGKKWQTALQSLFTLVSDHSNQLSPKCPSLRTKSFLKCTGGLRFRLTQCYRCRKHWAKHNSGLFYHMSIKLDHQTITGLPDQYGCNLAPAKTDWNAIFH